MPHAYRVIVLIETTGTYGRSLLRGIVRYARLHGPWLFYQESDSTELDLERILSWGADGIVMRDRKPFLELLSLQVPTIISANYSKSHNTPVITDDEEAIGVMAAQHFVDRGFKNFAYCGLPYFWSIKRGREFASYLAKQGYDIHIPKNPLNQSIDPKSKLRMNSELTAKWIASLPKPIAVLVANDHFGRNVIDALKEFDIKIPNEVAFVGVDDDEIACELCDPPLSSIKLNTERSGYLAAATLDEMMNGKQGKPSDIVIKPLSIVARQSTDIYVASDPDINDALNFIHNNARSPIQVRDVVEATSTSRRNLYYKFKQIRKRSILAEIKRARVEEITRLLLETDMNISKISYTMGFTDTSHISRYFRQIKKTDPSTYRKKYRV